MMRWHSEINCSRTTQSRTGETPGTFHLIGFPFDPQTRQLVDVVAEEFKQDGYRFLI
jgi:hypothetical protein